MAALASLLAILALSLLIVRIAAEALVLTGLSRETARFQARSAWTGTGFTTSESEAVMRNPVRRRIIGTLILARNAGLITLASTLVLSFVNVQQTGDGLLRLGVLFAALAALWLLGRSRWVNLALARVIAKALKRYTDLDTRDYAGLLHLAGDYAVMELDVRPDGWMVGRTLDELELSEEGILVLGIIEAQGRYRGAPRGSARLKPEDRVILYGRSHLLDQLSRRRADPRGDEEHRESVEERRREEEDDARSDSG